MSDDQVPTTAGAQEPEATGGKPANEKHAKEKKSARGSFVGVPVPVSSPALGSGVVLMGGYIFSFTRKDTISPPSVLGAAGLITDNGSRGLAAGTELYFNKDRYHVITGYARALLNYDFYGTGTSAGNAGRKFGLKQNVDAFLGEVTRRLFWHIFIGPRLLHGTTTLAPQHFGERLPQLPPLNVNFDLRSLGLNVERNTTTNRFYPVGGTSGKFTADFFDQGLGSTFTFQTYRATFNVYQTLAKNQVLAYNAYICATGGAAPFFGKCIFGTNNELRGYTAARYIDRDMFAGQIEYRVSLPWRLGAAAFAGLGQVAPSFTAFTFDNLLPSIGGGPRFQLSTKYHVNLHADFAQGKNGHTFSMGLGEAF